MLDFVWYGFGIATVYALVAGVVLGALGGRVSERRRALCAFAWPVVLAFVAIAAVPMLACWTGDKLGEDLGQRFTPRRRKSVAAGGHDASPIPYRLVTRLATQPTARFERRRAA